MSKFRCRQLHLCNRLCMRLLMYNHLDGSERTPDFPPPSLKTLSQRQTKSLAALLRFFLLSHSLSRSRQVLPSHCHSHFWSYLTFNTPQSLAFILCETFTLAPIFHSLGFLLPPLIMAYSWTSWNMQRDSAFCACCKTIKMQASDYARLPDLNPGSGPTSTCTFFLFGDMTFSITHAFPRCLGAGPRVAWHTVLTSTQEALL